MIRTNKQGFAVLTKIALPYFGISTAYAILVLFLEERFGDHIYMLSAQVGSVFGIAVAFFLGFRMNSAYDRWWEARKIFGELTNNSRSFAAKVYTYFRNPDNLKAGERANSIEIAADLIDLGSRYITQLKNEMHEKPHPEFDPETELLFKKYAVNTANKVTNEILIAISSKIEAVFSRESNIEKSDLMQHVNRFFDIQGKAERINNTPFLKIYSAFTSVTVTLYVLLIPFLIGDIDIGGEDNYLELLAIVFIAIIGTLFLTINRLANLYGAPLEENKTSVPIDQLCRGIVGNCTEVKMKLKENGTD